MRPPNASPGSPCTGFARHPGLYTNRHAVCYFMALLCGIPLSTPRPGPWRTLVDAAATVGFDWQRAGGGPHTAIADAQACRAVWIYLCDPLQLSER